VRKINHKTVIHSTGAACMVTTTLDGKRKIGPG